MKVETHTNWTEATTNINKAMMGLVSCLENGYNAWIELRNNGDQDYPIKIKNLELDNPFNWTMLYGVPTNTKELLDKKYFNETEKDLTYNWTACFGDKEAIDLYQSNGLITTGLCLGCGICHPIRKIDANKYRKLITKDNYEYGYWTTIWTAKDGISYYIVDKSIDKVFTICYNDEIQDKKQSLLKASQFLLDYANKI